MTNITIPNNSTLLQLYTQHRVKPAAKIQKLLIAILNHAHKEGEEQVSITLDSLMVPSSYSIVPAMLARNLAPHIDYPYIHAYLKEESGDSIEITASHNQLSRTFKGTILNELLTKQRAVRLRKQIPKTYRARPSILTNLLQKDIPNKIATIAKPKKIIWKLTTKIK